MNINTFHIVRDGNEFCIEPTLNTFTSRGVSFVTVWVHRFYKGKYGGVWGTCAPINIPHHLMVYNSGKEGDYGRVFALLNEYINGYMDVHKEDYDK